MENKKVFLLSFITLATLFLFGIGATYAYFRTQGDSSSRADVNVTTYTDDVLTFSIEKDLELYVTEPMLSKESSSVSTFNHAKATLKANNKTNEATEHYYLYLLIEENNLKYTEDKSNPELILSIKGPDGEVTLIENLEYKSVNDIHNESIKGFDITTKKGLYKIANNKEIKALKDENGFKEDDWEITLTFVNLNSNQNDNLGKKVKGKLIMQKEKIIESVGDVCKLNDPLSECIKLLNVDTNILATSLLHHDSNLTNGAGDDSYRYFGSNPYNYICFGSNDSPCPENNLYRIIGLIDNKIKLIKADYANSDLLGTDGEYTKSVYRPDKYYKGSLSEINKYYWNSTGANTWSTSKLNTINLNKNYYKNFDKNWQNLIDTTIWKVGGSAFDNLINVPLKTTYINEITNPSDKTTYTAKIGLMYVSDFGYASPQSTWSDDLSKLDVSDNWIYMGLNEWTLTKITDSYIYALLIDGIGFLEVKDVAYNHSLRPVFNLVDNIKFKSGMGTKSDPILIEN